MHEKWESAPGCRLGKGRSIQIHDSAWMALISLPLEAASARLIAVSIMTDVVSDTLRVSSKSRTSSPILGCFAFFNAAWKKSSSSSIAFWYSLLKLPDHAAAFVTS